MQLDAFFPFVLTEVIGCPDPTVRAITGLVVSEFCQKTLAWTEEQDLVPLVNGVIDYELDTPSQAYVVTIRDVWLGGRRLQPKSMAQVQDSLPDWQTSASSDPIFYNQSADRGSIRVFPIPANVTTQALRIRAAFAPNIASSSAPDFLGQRYMDVIASGIKARLMLMPGAPWSNPEVGGIYRQKYDDGLLTARIEEVHDRVTGSLTVTPRMFGF
jgi:hypothetical protein